MAVTVHPAVARPSRLWFAPRATGSFTRMWFKRRRSSGVRFYGGCAFWLCLLYIYAAAMAAGVAVWATVVTFIWTAQLLCLPVIAVRSVRHRSIH